METMKEHDDQEEQSRVSIPGDTVQIALTRLVSTGAIDEAGKTAIWWFFGHVRDKGMSLADAAKCIDYDATTVHRLFNGRYGASYGGILESIQRYRKLAEERSKRRDIGFIETSIWKKIAAVCRSALFDNMPAYIYGASQIGKTTCLQEFQRRNNHGQTRYLRIPAAPTLPLVISYLAEACFISTRHRQSDLRRRIMDALDDRTLLIVDEFHQAFIGTSDLGARKLVEFIREVYDRTGCGLVVSATNVGRDELRNGRQARVWEQALKRGLVQLQLPDRPPKSDVLKIASAFGLDEPPQHTMDLVGEMLSESGTGKFIKFLQYAHGLSVSRKTAMTWEHFAQAYDTIKTLSSQEKTDVR